MVSILSDQAFNHEAKSSSESLHSDLLRYTNWRSIVRFFFHHLMVLGLSIALVLTGGLANASTMEPTVDAVPPQSDTDETTIEMVRTEPGGVWTGEATSGEGVNILGVTWEPLSAQDPTGEARFRTRSEGTWGPWTEMAVLATDTSTGTEGDVVVDATDIQVEVEAKAEAATLTLLNVPEQVSDEGALDQRVDGTLVAPRTQGTDDVRSPDAASAQTVVIGTRAQWGADESLRKWSPNYMKETNGVTIHHTAGSNNYSAAQVPAILRGIYRYHAVTRDWGDVGYSMFVDRFGRAWEGRRGGPERSLRQAHAVGMNDNSAGIALVGNYSTTSVPRVAFDGLARVTAWKLATHGVSASGTFAELNDSLDVRGPLSTIHGHRDVNQTTCPGQRFYSRMREFRSKVGSYSRDAKAMQRVAGSDRYATAADLAQASHPFGVDTVYITHGEDIIESLTVGAATARQDDALLLTRTNDLPEATARQLKMLKPKEVVVVGGPSRINSRVLSAIKSVTKAPVRRIDVDHQYDLAATLAREWSTSKVVYVASGQESADSLAGGAAAAHDDAPLLLTLDRLLPATTSRELARLQPREVVVLGGKRRVPTAIMQKIRQAVPNATLTRIGGPDRYDTSAMISRQRFGTSSRAYIAQGVASIDAIAGTQYAAFSDSPVLLARKSCRPRSVARAMDELGTDLQVLLGGPRRLSDSSATAVCR